MQKFLFVCFILVVISCNENSGKTSMLEQPPYNILTDSIEKFPAQADLYYKRGQLLYKNEQPALAEDDIEKAWNMSPKEEYALSLATVYRQKNADTAIIFLQKANQQLPQSIAIEIALARGYQNNQQYQEAMKIADAVLQKHPEQLDALILKYEVLKALGKDADALKILETAYSFAPFDVELVHNLAFEYAVAGNSKVLALSDSLIRVDVEKSHAEPYYFKGLYYHAKKDVANAMLQLDEAMKHDYYFIDAYMEKGEIQFEGKKYEDALRTFRLASTISPTYADAYFWLGKTDEALGKKAEAKLNYQRAYGLDKTLTEAKTAADRL